MLEIVFSKENGKIKVRGTNINDTKNKKYRNINTDAALSIITETKKESNLNELISTINYQGNSLSFILSDVKIVLENRNDFVHDSNFKFVFDYIKNKNYIVTKSSNIKKIIVTAAALGLVISSSVIIKPILPPKKEEETNVSITSNLKTEEEKAVNENLFKTTPSSETLPEESTTLKEEVSTTKMQVIKSTTNLNQNNEITTKKVSETQKLTEEAITNALNEITESQIITHNNQYATSSSLKKSNDYNSNMEVIYLDDVEVGSLVGSDEYNRVMNNYSDIIRKYCNIYNVDFDIMCAIACQERGGVHSSIKDPGGAIGLMQIEVSVWQNNPYPLVVYNYEKGEKENLYVGSMNLGDVQTNIKVACATMRYHMTRMNENKLLSIQSYAQGEGTMDKVLKAYSNETGLSINQIKNDKKDTGWAKYTKNYRGTPYYYKYCLRFYSGSEFKQGTIAKTR